MAREKYVKATRIFGAMEITVDRGGVLRVTSAVINKLGVDKANFVVLEADKDAKMAFLNFTTDKVDNAMAVGKSGTIAGKAFSSWAGIPIENTVRYPIVLKGSEVSFDYGKNGKIVAPRQSKPKGIITPVATDSAKVVA